MTTSEPNVLRVHVSKIPPEGQDVDARLDPAVLHLEGEKAFDLQQGRLLVHLDKGEENTVHVVGTLQASLGLECGRCLEPVAMALDHPIDLFYLPRHKENQAEEQDADVQLSDHQMVVAYYDQDLLDLGEMVREQIFLLVPMRRLCREDCRGICPECGKNNNTERCECVPPTSPDPRLAELGKLFDKQ